MFAMLNLMVVQIPIEGVKRAHFWVKSILGSPLLHNLLLLTNYFVFFKALFPLAFLFIPHFLLQTLFRIFLESFGAGGRFRVLAHVSILPLLVIFFKFRRIAQHLYFLLLGPVFGLGYKFDRSDQIGIVAILVDRVCLDAPPRIKVPLQVTHLLIYNHCLFFLRKSICCCFLL